LKPCHKFCDSLGLVPFSLHRRNQLERIHHFLTFHRLCNGIKISEAIGLGQTSRLFRQFDFAALGAFHLKESVIGQLDKFLFIHPFIRIKPGGSETR